MAPLHPLLEVLLPNLAAITDAAGAPTLDLAGPVAARPLVVAALAEGATSPVLAITATGREADELVAVLSDLLGKDVVANLPSWETLPHERLSPRADTVGGRLAILRRLAHPEEQGPLKVVVATVRSLIQPMAPGLGELAPVHLKTGGEHDFEQVHIRLADHAYARVDMV